LFDVWLRAEAERRSVLVRQLAKERHPRGFHWCFRADSEFRGMLRELVQREHACCPFLTFTLRASECSITWEVSGPPGAEGFVDVFYRMPSTLRELDTLVGSVNDAGLGLACKPETE